MDALFTEMLRNSQRTPAQLAEGGGQPAAPLLAPFKHKSAATTFPATEALCLEVTRSLIIAARALRK